MSQHSDFNHFFNNNKQFFNLFNDMPIKGILRSVWNKKGSESNHEIDALQSLLQRMKVLKGEAEAKVESRNLELRKKDQITKSIIDQQDFYIEEINELKNQKQIALEQVNLINTKLLTSEKEKKEIDNKIKYVNSLENAVTLQKKTIQSIEDENLMLHSKNNELFIEHNLSNKQKNILYKKVENQQQILKENTQLKKKTEILEKVKHELEMNFIRINDIKKLQEENSLLKLSLIEQDQEIDDLKSQKIMRNNELEQLIYEKEELSIYAKNYKKLNHKLSNEVYRLSVN